MMEELLNLDNLSQEEKDKILGVLQKDEMVRQAEDKKIWWVWSKCYMLYTWAWFSNLFKYALMGLKDFL